MIAIIMSFAVDLQGKPVGRQNLQVEFTSFCMLQNGDLHAAKR